MREKVRKWQSEKLLKTQSLKWVVCRICGKKTRLVSFEQHSDLCRGKEEAKKEAKVLDEDLFKFYQKAEKCKKHLNMKICLVNNMLDKMSRKCLQSNKKEESSPKSDNEQPETRRRAVTKSRFAKEARNQDSSNFIFGGVEAARNEILEDESLNNNPMLASTMDYLNNDNNDEIKPRPNEGLFIKIPKAQVSEFMFCEAEEEEKENGRIRSGSGGNFNNKRANLTRKLANLRGINELSDPVLEELQSGEDYISSPRLNIDSPTMKPSCNKEISNQQQLKTQLKFLNAAVLTFSLIIEFIQKMSNEAKIPQNIDFWFNSQRENLDFLILRISESSLSEEYIQKGDNIKKFNERLLETAKKKIAVLKTLRSKESLLESLNSSPTALPFKNKASRKLPAKFSFTDNNNPTEYLSASTRTRPEPESGRPRFREAKAKSEEKYKGGPLYQIFLAKYPDIQLQQGKSPRSPTKRGLGKEPPVEVSEQRPRFRTSPRKAHKKPCTLFPFNY